MSENMKVTARKTIQNIRPYTPGKPIWELQIELGLLQVIKLASNENPLGPSPKALEAVQRSLADIHRYPDAGALKLKQVIASKLDMKPEQLILTNGGDELITLISETFLEPGDEIIVLSPSFSEYEFGAHLMGGERHFRTARRTILFRFGCDYRRGDRTNQNDLSLFSQQPYRHLSAEIGPASPNTDNKKTRPKIVSHFKPMYSCL